MKLDFALCRSRRKSLALQLDREGNIILRSPLGLTRKQAEEFVLSHADWIARQRRRLAEYRAAHPEPTAEEEARLRALARQVLPQRVEHYAARMGLRPTGVKITSARSRFGSCSSKNSLCFSWRLMAYPPEAVDYVVVHELAHIRHKSHSSAFYACIAAILPDHKQRRALLKQ